MRVLYDISLFAEAGRNPLARTGVFRVVHDLGEELVASGRCEVRFTAGMGLDQHHGVLGYRRDHHWMTGTRMGDGWVARWHWWMEGLLKGLRSEGKTGEGRGVGRLHQGLVRRFRRLGYGLQARGLMDMTSKGSRAWADVWHSPLWSLPEFGGERRPLQFVTVYDLIAVLFPAYFVGNPEPVRRLERDLKMFHRDQYFLCISEATRRDLCNHCPGIDPAKAFVTPLAASRAFYRCSDGVVLRGIRRKFGIPEGGRYLLSVATIEPRKNVVAIVRAFCWLVMERGMDELYLVLVGAQGWDSGAVSREVREAPERVRERIIATGYVSDGELAPLYSGAEAFVYPSFYEGFGLPPLEAMQCGTPVITSNVSSLPEVVGDAGILVDPGDQGAICGAIEGLLGDGEMAAGLREKGLRRAAEFSWKACAARTLDAYEAGLGRVRRA